MQGLIRRLPAITAIAIAAIVAVLVSGLLVRMVEARSLSDVGQVLRLSGFDWARVSVDGLQVRVTGTAPSEAARFRALAAAGTVVDSARVLDEVTVEERKLAAPEFSIEILRNDGDISLIGLLPATMDRAAFVAAVSRLAAEGEVTDLLEPADHPAPAGWDAAVDFGLAVLAELPRSKISIAPGRVAIKAIADSGPDRRRLESAIERRRPEGLEVAVEITAPRPAITPFTLRFVIAAGGAARFDACSADTEAARERILRAAAEAGLAGPAGCTIGIGAPTPRWGDAAVLAIGAVKALGGGAVTLSDTEVSLVALETADRTLFDTVTGTLDNQLPEAYSLTAVLPEPVETDGTGEGDGPPEMVATLLDGGSLQLRGRVRDDRQMQVITSYAKGLFGAADVQNALRMDEHVPESWTVRVLAALHALKDLTHGRALVRADFVEISGVTGDPDLRAEVSRLLAEKLGEGANFRIDITYDTKLDPVLGLPTAEECVAEINAAIAAQKITFPPGSAELDPAAGAVLDQIAGIMRNCGDYPMEIGGHTDSQGRETMNQELSQARAEAVLNALMERRVLTGNLTALGYGETRPVADNGTEQGREANRRIEFRLVSGQEDAADAQPAGDAAASAPEDAPGEGAGDSAGEGQAEGE